MRRVSPFPGSHRRPGSSRSRPPPVRSTPRSREPSRSNTSEYSRSPPSVRRDAAPFVKPVSENRPSGPEKPRWRRIIGSSCSTHDSPNSRTPATGRPSGSTARPVTAKPGPSSTTGGASTKRSNTVAVRATCETRTAERSRSDTVKLTLPSASEVPKPRASGRPAAIPEPTRNRFIRAPARGAPSAVTCTVRSTARCNTSSAEASSGATSRQVEAKPSRSAWRRQVSSLRGRESDGDATVVVGSRCRGTCRHISAGAAVTLNSASAAASAAASSTGSALDNKASGACTRMVSGLEELASARQAAAASSPGSRSRGGQESLHAQHSAGARPAGTSSRRSHISSAGTAIPSRKTGFALLDAYELERSVCHRFVLSRHRDGYRSDHQPRNKG